MPAMVQFSFQHQAHQFLCWRTHIPEPLTEGDHRKAIENVSIHNFKNVVDGSIDLTTKKKGLKASILGLYVQNGSDKTALIDAIQLLQYALQGRKVPASFADCINVEAQYARLSFAFLVNNSFGTYHATYSFSLRKEKDETAHNAVSNSDISDFGFFQRRKQ